MSFFFDNVGSHAFACSLPIHYLCISVTCYCIFWYMYIFPCLFLPKAFQNIFCFRLFLFSFCIMHETRPLKENHESWTIRCGGKMKIGNNLGFPAMLVRHDSVHVTFAFILCEPIFLGLTRLLAWIIMIALYYHQFSVRKQLCQIFLQNLGHHRSFKGTLNRSLIL